MTQPETTDRVDTVIPAAPTVTKAIDEIADQLGTAITGDFNFVIHNASEDRTVQKLAIMVNFLLETIRQALSDQDAQKRRELEALVAELQSALLFKEQFLATMSHELRTPLNAIIGYAGIGLSEDFSEEAEHYFERIRINAMRQLSLINDILDISRLNAKRLEILSIPVVLHDLVKGWYEDFKKVAADHQLEFTLELDSTLPLQVNHDPDRLTQIVNNLLTNAFKYTEAGSVKLAVKRVDDANWAISVSDTGKGIPEMWQQVIFEEFRRVDGSSARKSGGVGLGLAIVQKFCLLMNGQIALSSTVGKGSTFTATLPLNIQLPQTHASVA
jgi:signal transduction histidine kinase